MLERRPGDAESVNRLFRAIHTLKGSSGLFDAAPLTRVLHAAEDVFQAVRERLVTLSPDLVDLALEMLDQVGRWIDYLDSHETLPAAVDPIATKLQNAFRTWLGDTAPRAEASVPTPNTAETYAALPQELAKRFGEAALMVSVAPVFSPDRAFENSPLRCSLLLICMPWGVARQ